jgi:hypothetical protein
VSMKQMISPLISNPKPMKNFIAAFTLCLTITTYQTTFAQIE